MFKYSATGKVRYSRHKEDGGQGWIVIDCPFDIAYYYNRVCNWLLWTNKRITLPLHGAHITVVAGKYTDVPRNLWGYRDGEEVEFRYGSIQDNGGNYFWLPVQCEAAEDIRTTMGLTPTPKFQYHLTIGHMEK